MACNWLISSLMGGALIVLKSVQIHLYESCNEKLLHGSDCEHVMFVSPYLLKRAQVTSSMLELQKRFDRVLCFFDVILSYFYDGISLTCSAWCTDADACSMTACCDRVYITKPYTHWRICGISNQDLLYMSSFHDFVQTVWGFDICLLSIIIALVSTYHDVYSLSHCQFAFCVSITQVFLCSQASGHPDSVKVWNVGVFPATSWIVCLIVTCCVCFCWHVNFVCCGVGSFCIRSCHVLFLDVIISFCYRSCCCAWCVRFVVTRYDHIHIFSMSRAGWFRKAQEGLLIIQIPTWHMSAASTTMAVSETGLAAGDAKAQHFYQKIEIIHQLCWFSVSWNLIFRCTIIPWSRHVPYN